MGSVTDPRVPGPDLLVLWDIDLTLVDYSGIGRDWYGQAMTAAHGLPIRHVPTFPGRTERAITAELLEAHGIAVTEETVQALFAELVAIADAARADMPTLGRALPGAAALLAALAEHPGVVQSLVTGNLPELAACKLEAFDLHHHLDFEVGGYGGVSPDRHELVKTAMQAASAKYGTDFEPGRVVVIGDTPHDVAAALHHGAIGVGVATGRSSVSELRDSGAHLVLEDLSDTPAVLAALVGAASRTA
ncbi:HAD family hydrolase [Actinokineospora sp. UTMC 2448]|uniref:HAD family hydrolase n=1 Tax=Actinokineospora sp. UTMC 2448 TaxID=2268449 RepID=UPI0021F9CBFF|nr:phosphoglycolate phosphatase [Actinokineospora sp. UTMC 2448]